MERGTKEAGRGYRNYLLALLLVILAFNLMDRLVLGLVLQDIKRDLALSDTQLGLLSGLAFAAFYSVMGIPIARWADRGNRVTVISLTAALWSVMVALCGLAVNFVQMLLIRIGVGIGEAGCVSPAYSLIADYFDRAERPRAAAIYALGSPLSMVIGYFSAGWLNEAYGWRVTFVVLGIPGVLLAVVARATLKEPRVIGNSALGDQQRSGPQADHVRLRDVCVFLWHNKTFRHLLYGTSIMYFFAYGILQWQPAFFMRSFAMQTGELGTWLAALLGGGGLIGVYLGGVLSSRYAARDERVQLRAMAWIYVCLAAISILTYLAPDRSLAFSLLALGSAGLSCVYGPLFATIQTLIPENMRATAVALINLFANLIGMGLGPLATGLLSDGFRPWAGDDSLRYALIALCPGYCWVAWHLWRAATSVADDLASERDGGAAPQAGIGSTLAIAVGKER